MVSSCARLRFGGFERKRKRERRSSLFFFVRRAFGTTVFHRFWSGARAGRERERERKRKISARPFNLNFLQIKQPDPYRPSPFSDRIYRETKDHEKKRKKKKKKKKKKRERER